MDITETIRKYIKEDVNSSNISFEDNESLYDLGILDSLRIVQLMAFLYSKFKISIDPSDLQIEDFETVDNIVACVKKYKKDGEGNV